MINNIIDKFLKRSNSQTVSEKGFDIVSHPSIRSNASTAREKTPDPSQNIPISFHKQYPFLNLKERLSQIWLNKYTLVLILMIFKIFLFKKDLNSSLNSASNYTKQACSSVEQYASTITSLPHYITQMSNKFIVQALNELNADRVKSLQMIVTIVENLIIFSIESIIGTYTCLITAAVDAAADIALDVVDEAVKLVNDTVVGLADDVQDGLDDIATVLNKIISVADKVEDFFDGDSTDDGSTYFKNVNLTISSLKNISIPTSVLTKINSLKSDIPDFDQVENYTTSLIKKPFDLLKTDIGNSLNNITISELEASPLEIISICSNSTKIDDFYKDLADTLHTASTIIIVLLVVVALIMMVPIAFEEYLHWRKMAIMANELEYEMINQQSTNKQNIKNAKLAQIYEIIDRHNNKIPYYFSLIINKFKETSTASNSKIRWVVSYVSSKQALPFLGIGLAGIITVGLQFILLRIISKSLSFVSDEFHDIAKTVESDIGGSVTNWTTTTNDFLSSEQVRINDDLFGWVQDATTHVNGTVVEFMDKLNSTIYDAFYGTMFYTPMSNVVYCEVGRKLIKIEEGLQWIHDNAEITLPRITSDFLNSTLSDISDSSTNDSVVSNAINDVKKTFKDVVAEYKKSLLIELYISLAILGIWFLQLIIGLTALFIKDWYYQRQLDISQIPMQNVYGRVVSNPIPLTTEEQKNYGYPYINDANEKKLTPIREDDNISFQSQTVVDYRNTPPKTYTSEELETNFNRFSYNSLHSVITKSPEFENQKPSRNPFNNQFYGTHDSYHVANNNPFMTTEESQGNETESPFNDRNVSRMSTYSVSRALTPYYFHDEKKID